MRRRRNSEKLSRARRFRLVPLVMSMATLLFGIKAFDVYQGSQRLSEFLIAGSAVAEDEAPKGESDKLAEAKKKMEEEAEADKATKASAGGNEEEAYIPPPQRDRQQFSQVELDILQSLSQRREELDEFAREMDLKEKVLATTELRINDKLAEITKLKNDVTVLLKQYEGEEQTHLSSLVKIYENMKPKDAAAIFNEMDIHILLDVIDLMSERKVAPVLAGMTPDKARQVTEELAEKRRLQPARDALKNM